MAWNPITESHDAGSGGTPNADSGATTSSVEPSAESYITKGLGLQNKALEQYVDYQGKIAPIQYQEMVKGIARADDQYEFDKARTIRLDQQNADQFGFTMDYNKAALASQGAAASGANAAAMANAGANGQIAATNARLADSSIKMNDYQYQQMQERDKRWREVGIPQEDALIAKVKEMGSEKYRDQQIGKAVGDVTQGFADSRQQTLRAMGRMGMNGNSGQMASMMARGNADQALALAGTKNNMRTSLAQTDLANKFQLNGAMKGMAGMGDMSANLAINSISAGKQAYGPQSNGASGNGFSPMGFGGGGGGGGSGPNAGLGMSIANMGASGIGNNFHTGAGMASTMSTGGNAYYNTQLGNTTAPATGWQTAGNVLGFATGAAGLYNMLK
jgi:hypothetical protein